MLAVLVVVIGVLATSGWLIRPDDRPADPRTAETAAWDRLVYGPDAAAQTSPAAVSRYFAGLNAASQRHLADRYPLVVGNLNGAPAEIRYRANRVALRQAIDVERRWLKTADASAWGARNGRRKVHRYESLLSSNRHILGFDPSGDGRAIEVIGDLDTAERIEIVVPGADNGLLNFERTVGAVTAPAGMARNLYNEIRAQDPGAKVAVIAWADYQTPARIGIGALTGALADRGAVRLRAFIRALPERARASVFCHSYGTVVCGRAAQQLPAERRLSNLTVMGSPGMRTDSAAELAADRVWATRVGDDWVGELPFVEFAGFGHGADPTGPGFGARVFGAEGAHGHTGYFAEGTDSLRNMARIALGNYTSVTCSNARS
ncbi:hypothetical protein G5C51_29720 [Streptomyces sp. A7024]|uniref:DUF1023 domain-containing protein n=2 Tax=Streptomyces coryli TaxID=1128680 RepID=A0A6G4U8N5_9ACTN|nr:alpha/beta hydrolase [Streptomyces coryli]NGN68066.1 hypothetical protein [Streptomyces coryli]